MSAFPALKNYAGNAFFAYTRIVVDKYLVVGHIANKISGTKVTPVLENGIRNTENAI
jgi:hypothetical protein